MPKILLVEDDPILGRSLALNLKLEGYEVEWAETLQSGFSAFKQNKFDLILLDLGLPDGHGFNLCQEIRSKDKSLPIVILTAQADESSVVEGLNLGASDYVRKPFGLKELAARVRCALRESKSSELPLRFSDLKIFIDQRRAFFGEHELELKRREFDILTYLTDRAEQVVTREALLSKIDQDGEISDRTIDSHVSHLRSHLKGSGISSIHIASIYGVGYRLEKTR
ncbi:MAG: hypothetical protein JWQ35_701 [Bacteriovoracaceae bacterium]|nr:hypothetical protein [Bacteriovoracaceae bacterium]